MSDAKIKATIIGRSKKAWTWYSSERKQAIEAATVRTPIKKADGSNSGRFTSLVRCAMCNDLFPKSEINVDHIHPVGKGFGWPPGQDMLEWAQRLFCKVENLQCLCKACHRRKSAKEKKEGKYK